MSFLPIRVLVVEEHPFKQLVATQVFKDSGCEWVMGVADVAAALELLDRTGPVDIVLCTLKEEGLQGLTTLEALSRTRWVRSMIICSSHAQDLHDAIERMLGLLGVSFLGYVDAPVRAAAIAVLLTRYLETTVANGHPVSRQARHTRASKARLEHAIARDELKSFFQPKFNLMTGKSDSLEVLARWEYPQFGVLPPADFLAQAGRFGLMDELFFSLLEQALAFLQTAQEQGHVLSLAFNLEAGQLACKSLLPRLCAALERYAIPPSRLTFEITESGLLEVSPGVLQTLIRLRMMGAGLSIDDFGIGYSSLERLCQLPFTEIKLDARFARDLETSSRNRAVISSTLALAQALDMAVVVEGVEHESQRQGLLKLGCELGQGYLCARPMSATRALAWLGMKSVSCGTL
ncbi:EAL domain-containing protein [Pseudomonas shahriarae]|uniref:EAL domain-containing response regulator n=1 Tax=Pseudomonas shahriarae TaxID=2745512 RepID=A0ABT5NIH7_9PSED|nr:EAL domain-containing response regulator [Pseudomonas shahriarae]MDD0987457.1 EAL domain-containing response regulator [Pseudomonas shahriarae]MDD1033680.1 EAL domain-containing response regulator [Pseudomonas shahriarae]